MTVEMAVVMGMISFLFVCCISALALVPDGRPFDKKRLVVLTFFLIPITLFGGTVYSCFEGYEIQKEELVSPNGQIFTFDGKKLNASDCFLRPLSDGEKVKCTLFIGKNRHFILPKKYSYEIKSK